MPTALNLLRPGGGPAVPMGIEGETRYTLTSVTFDGADRIAHLTSHVTSTVSPGPSSAPSGPPVAFDLTMTGDGKSDVNVDPRPGIRRRHSTSPRLHAPSRP